MDEIREQPTRRRILAEIERTPGASARDLQRATGLGWGQTSYHLDRLVRSGLVRRERGGHRDFYFPAEVRWDDRRLLQALHSPTQRALLQSLVRAPDLSFEELRVRARVAKSTASFHLRWLVEHGLVETVYRDGARRYRSDLAERVRELLERHAELLRPRLADRLMDSVGSVLGGVPAASSDERG